MKIEAKFCHVCGCGLKMLYPGCYDPKNPTEHIRADLARPPDERVLGPENLHPMGDPENGPKSLRCPAGHTPIEEVIEDAVHAAAPTAYREILEEIQEGCQDPHIQPSDTVKLAAGLLLEWDTHLDLHYAKLVEEEEAENAANMPDLGPDYDGG